jgi:hypothetical protein
VYHGYLPYACRGDGSADRVAGSALSDGQILSVVITVSRNPRNSSELGFELTTEETEMSATSSSTSFPATQLIYAFPKLATLNLRRLYSLTEFLASPCIVECTELAQACSSPRMELLAHFIPSYLTRVLNLSDMATLPDTARIYNRIASPFA